MRACVLISPHAGERVLYSSAPMQEPERLDSLDHRRMWARLRAPVWVVAGAVFAGGAAAGAGLLILGALAYGWSRLLDRSIRDFPLWGWAGEVAEVLGAAVGLVIAGTIVLYGLFGAPAKLLHEIAARPLDDRRGSDLDEVAATRFRNVAEELSLGLGVDAPRLALIDDPAPNALSVRQWSRRTLVATTGLMRLPRDEVEAVLAHEMAHLHAHDARWITAAESSVASAHRITGLIAGLGGLVAGLGLYLDLIVSLIALGLLLAIVGGLGRVLVGRAMASIRRESDELADVAAILLARNPESLGNVCARLVHDRSEVAVRPERARLLWFKLVSDDSVSAAGAARELETRADAAYREARLARPPLSPSTT